MECTTSTSFLHQVYKEPFLLDKIKDIKVFVCLYINTTFERQLLQSSDSFDFVIFNLNKNIDISKNELLSYSLDTLLPLNNKHNKIEKLDDHEGIHIDTLLDVGVFSAITNNNENPIECIKELLDLRKPKQLALIKEYTKQVRKCNFRKEEMLFSEMSTFCQLIKEL